jgi:hypothetical protein
MSSTSEPTDLQFDRADFAGSPAAAPACAVCQQAIDGTYFEVNGQMACATCHDAIVRAHGGTAGSLGVLKAIGAGVGAGIAGALLYYAVLALTGYELGLIAVAVGFMVGAAVRWGSGGRGGRVYQVLAVAITYVAIVSTYVPFMFAAVRDAQETTVSAPATATATTAATAAGTGASAPAAPVEQAAPSETTSAQSAPARTEATLEPVTPGRFLFLIVMLAGIILASPFLAGFGNIIGWLIIGFALFEAWKANRRVQLQIAGPFTLAPAADARPADAV